MVVVGFGVVQVNGRILKLPYQKEVCFQCMQLQAFPCVQSVVFPKVLAQHVPLQARNDIAQFQLY